jgi:hypothetical protein
VDQERGDLIALLPFERFERLAHLARRAALRDTEAAERVL